MDETIVTPESEKIDSPAIQAEVKVEEGTVEAEMQKLIPDEKKEVSQETVPLKVFLDLKQDLKDLKKEMKEASSSKQSQIRVQGVNDLVAKYPDVSADFINDILSSAKSAAEQELDSKYAPMIQKQKQKEEVEAFNKAFDNVYEKALKDNPDLPENVDKELIKTLVLTPKYKNVKIADILITVYGNNSKGKIASENDTVTAAGEIETITSFDKITPEQKTAIMADPKARAKFFDWLDTQPGR
jgi:hypothetical protein